MVVAVPVGMIRLVRSHMWPIDQAHRATPYTPQPYVRGMAMALSRIIKTILKISLFETPLGVYSYKEILFIADYNSSIEGEESFKYPLDHLELRLKLEKKQ